MRGTQWSPHYSLGFTRVAKYALQTDDEYPATAPSGLPPPGYVAPAVVRGVITADRLMVDLIGDGVEITLVLAGVTPAGPVTMPGDGHPDQRQLTPRARVARDIVGDIIDAAGHGPRHRHHVFLPRPRHLSGRWITGITAGSCHVGLLYLAGHGESLNSLIAARGITETDAQCPYLRPSWNRPRVVA